MVVSINGEEHAQLKTSGRTLGDILSEVRALQAESGKMVVGIVCDGQLLSPDSLNTVLPQPADTYATIDFQTAEPRELARESLNACREYVKEMEGCIEDVVDALQKSDIQAAMGQMGALFSRLNETYRGLQNVFELLRIDPESVELSSGSAARLMVGMVDQLREIKNALESRDYVQLADLLEYELKPTVEQWYQLIDNLLESFAGD